MAKAGFWLRGARGKLAGASAQKGQNGTILREIVKPRNPKTDKQIYQRAIMATVMKAYSAGKEIFDHAFQGVEKGQKSQQYFIARNATLLRSLIAQDINAIAAGTMQPTEAVNACVAPKALYPVPGAFMISEGTYEQSFFDVTVDLGWETVKMVAGASTAENRSETISEYAQRTGLIPGDIYTLVALVPNNKVVFNGVDESGQLSNIAGTKQQGCSFAYIRMQVKSDVLTNNTAAAAEWGAPIELKLVFDITGQLNANLILNEEGEIPNGTITVNGSYGIIRSRIDEDLRSTSYMVLTNDYSDTEITGEEPIAGITSPYVLPTWKKGTDALGTSELILESDN